MRSRSIINHNDMGSHCDVGEEVYETSCFRYSYLDKKACYTITMQWRDRTIRIIPQ